VIRKKLVASTQKGPIDNDGLFHLVFLPDGVDTDENKQLNADGSLADSKVFGASLEDLAKRADSVDGVPSFVRACIEYLKHDKAIRSVGLFRESGRALLINNVREAINDGQCMWLLLRVNAAIMTDEFVLPGAHAAFEDLLHDHDDITIHSVAGLLKRFFRDLAVPLIPSTLNDMFMRVYGMGDAAHERVFFGSLH